MSEVVNTLSPSGPASQFKTRVAIDFGSIAAPFVKEVTAPVAGVDAGDLVSVSPAQALAAGVIGGSARVSATGVIAVQLGTTGGTTLTPNTVTFDVYVTKGSTAA